MRVALCLSGQPRFWNGLGFESIRRFLLEPYRPDVFFHTWWSAQDVGKRYDAAPWSGVAGSEALAVRAEILESLLEIYSPQRYQAEPMRTFEPARDYSGSVSHPTYTVPNLLSQTYSLQRSAQLREEYQQQTGADYDWVVRCRFDSLFESFPPLEKLPKGRILIPDINPNPHLLYDCVSLSNPFDDSQLADRHHRLDAYFLQGAHMNAEHIFTHHVLSLRVAPRILKLRCLVGHCRAWSQP